MIDYSTLEIILTLQRFANESAHGIIPLSAARPEQVGSVIIYDDSDERDEGQYPVISVALNAGENENDVVLETLDAWEDSAPYKKNDITVRVYMPEEEGEDPYVGVWFGEPEIFVVIERGRYYPIYKG